MKPTTSAPRTAPPIWPIPPTKAEATMITVKVKPVTALKLTVSAQSSTPATPHITPEITQLMVVTRSVAMPQVLASSLLVAMARICRPREVFSSSEYAAPSKTTALTTETKSALVQENEEGGAHEEVHEPREPHHTEPAVPV